MSNNRKLFGTDGIRGVANIEPVTAETALKLGRAAAHVFAEARASSRSGRLRVVIGKDTRLSGYMIESALTAGFTSVGDLLAEASTGKGQMLTMNKVGPTGVVNVASSLWRLGNLPSAGATGTARARPHGRFGGRGSGPPFRA
jgi:hypothetical protein